MEFSSLHCEGFHNPNSCRQNQGSSPANQSVPTGAQTHGLRKILLQNRRQRWVACWVEFMLSTLYFTDQDFLSVIVQHLQPLNGNDLKIRSAPHRILDTIDLKIVFPAQPKIKAFQKYIKGKGFYMYFKHWLNVCSFILS